jgi:hypothetical protein
METLHTLAEVTITIVGFAALFSILKVKKGKWNDRAKWNLIRFYSMIEFGVILMFFCFLPIILSGFLDTQLAFRISSILLLVGIILLIILTFKRNNKLKCASYNSAISTKILFFAGFVILITDFLNVFGILGTNLEANYLAIMFCLLIYSLYFFVRLIYFSIDKPGIEN